ncbi:hypothetical protein [Streptomyces sp. NPDC059850]|uniref:hypothetical protein n=1 Tax=Streptomyces sp. NPDC059850 TaxID=3346970 RepID=UPI003651E9C1
MASLRAVALLNAASAERGEGRMRSRAFDAIAAARALFVVGDIDAACDAGRRAIEVGSTVDSARVRRRFQDLAREAAPHQATPTVRALREALLGAGTDAPRA